jgi:hypothetical protein
MSSVLQASLLRFCFSLYSKVERRNPLYSICTLTVVWWYIPRTFSSWAGPCEQYIPVVINSCIIVSNVLNTPRMIHPKLLTIEAQFLGLTWPGTFGLGTDRHATYTDISPTGLAWFRNYWTIRFSGQKPCLDVSLHANLLYPHLPPFHSIPAPFCRLASLPWIPHASHFPFFLTLLALFFSCGPLSLTLLPYSLPFPLTLLLLTSFFRPHHPFFSLLASFAYSSFPSYPPLTLGLLFRSHSL